MALVFPNGAVRVNVRPGDGRFGIDYAGHQLLAGHLPGGPCTLRIAVSRDAVRVQTVDEDGPADLASIPRAEFPGTPTAVRVGQMGINGGATDYAEAGTAGESHVAAVRVYQGALAGR